MPRSLLVKSDARSYGSISAVQYTRLANNNSDRITRKAAAVTGLQKNFTVEPFYKCFAVQRTGCQNSDSRRPAQTSDVYIIRFNISFSLRQESPLLAEITPARCSARCHLIRLSLHADEDSVIAISYYRAYLLSGYHCNFNIGVQANFRFLSKKQTF